MQQEQRSGQIKTIEFEELSVRTIFPEQTMEQSLEQHKKSSKQFISQCMKDKKLCHEVIDLGVKICVFPSEYIKKIAHFCNELLCNQSVDIFGIFIQQGLGEVQDEIRNSNTGGKQGDMEIRQEIQREVEQSTALTDSQFQQKYAGLGYLLEYLCRPVEQIEQVCVNYLTKVMLNIIANKPVQVYEYFARAKVSKFCSGEETMLQRVISLISRFASISQLLGKMISEEGDCNKYILVKKQIVDSLIVKLKDENLLLGCPQNYNYVLDFVGYVFSRNKYKSDDTIEMLASVTQRFVDEDILWFYKERVIRVVMECNKLVCGEDTMSRKSQSVKSGKNGSKNNGFFKINQKQFVEFENVFENCVGYLKILAQRLNFDEEVDQFAGESFKVAEPTMDFQVDEVLFGENSLFELLTLPIPLFYRNVNRMSYYQFLLRLTRNSRYNNAEKQLGLLPSSYTPVLIHLLRSFRKEFDINKNGLVNFFIESIICQAILPKIIKLDDNEGMKVISALDLSEQTLVTVSDSRVFIYKILFILQAKCQWFKDHFIRRLGIDLEEIGGRFRVKLAGHCNIFKQRKGKVRELAFLEVDGEQEQKSCVKSHRQKFRDDYDSSSNSSSDFEKEMKNLSPDVSHEQGEDDNCVQFRLSQKIEARNEMEKMKDECEEVNGIQNVSSDIIDEEIIVNTSLLENQEPKNLNCASFEDEGQGSKNRKKSQNIILGVESADEDEANGKEEIIEQS